jgi:hypothetical protein
MVSEKFDLVLDGVQVAKAKTAGDLVKLVECQFND